MSEANEDAQLSVSEVMRSVLADLQSKLDELRNQMRSFDDCEARWRDGMEYGLETAIELLKDALTKHVA